MTRINTVPPNLLTNKHLMAEYRELPRIFTAVRKLVDKGLKPSDLDIPKSYRLGAGHVTFFYDKLWWLTCRFSDIFNELKRRGFKVDAKKFKDVQKSAWKIPVKWQGDYEPTPEDYYLNMARLARRSRIDKVLDEMKSEN